MKNHLSLRFDFQKADPRLVRRLPPEIACRYHAVPIATDGSQVTVAMAYPLDGDAFAAVTTALGSPVHLVQADPQNIDQLLADNWHLNPGPALRLLAWAASAELGAELTPYADSVARLLGANLDVLTTHESGTQALQSLSVEAEQSEADLLLISAGPRSLFQRLFSESPETRLMGQTCASLLAVREPRWPLSRILLILRSEAPGDEFSLDWTLRFAQSGGAAVTILPILPPAPLIYQGLPAMQASLPALLGTDTPLGKDLRRVAQHLVAYGVEGAIRVRNEPLSEQIACEVHQGDYDLIVIAGEPRDRFSRWFKEGLVRPLLGWADRPVLVAQNRPMSTLFSLASADIPGIKGN